MKRVANGEPVRASSSDEEPNCKNRKVEQGSSIEMVEQGPFVFFPTELQKEIFLYSIEEEQRSPLALGQVSRAFYAKINCFIQGILEENYTSDDLSPFKSRLLPNFQVPYLAIPSICYLYALRNLTDSICLCYKKTFEYYLNLYINSWSEYGLQFNRTSDNCYRLFTASIPTSCDTNNYYWILVLNKCFERYLLSHRIAFDQEFARTQSLLEFIADHNSQEKYLNIIQTLFFHFYQQCVSQQWLSNDPHFIYLRALVVLTKTGAVSPNRIQKLKDLAIAKLSDPSTPPSCYPHAIELMVELVLQNLKLVPDEIKFLKDIAITKLSDSSTPPIQQHYSIELLAELQCQNLSLEPGEIKFLKDFVIIKLIDPSIQSDFQIYLCCFLDQLLLQNLELRSDEINSLKKLAIAKLSDQSISPEQVHWVCLLIELLPQNLRFQSNEIDSIKNYAVRKFSDESCSLKDHQWMLILLSRILNPGELFDLVPLEFLRDKFLDGIYSHLLENNPQYAPSTNEKLANFYALWMTHPDSGVQSLANEIYRVIKSSQECI